MKGVVLAGGTGSRLHPLTKSINKHCLPIYDRPMIYYPIQSLVEAGISDIILVAGGNHMSQFIDLLGDGSELNCNISYVAQMEPGGIAEAISLVQPFTNDEPICVILGDNIFLTNLKDFVDKFENQLAYHDQCIINAVDDQPHCQVMCKEVPKDEAVNYGILSHGSGDEEQNKAYGQTYISEKPTWPYTHPDGTMFKAVTGLYMYTPDVFDKIKNLKRSARGEYEVSELNDIYGRNGDLSYSVTDEPWYDCGVDIDHMLEVSNKMKEYNEQK